MCGICGIVDKKTADLRSIVSDMCSVLAHRGPDGEGIIARQEWALGHRRLSVIDLSENARQPFVSEDEKSFLVCNGEIYNHCELRKSLLQEGHRFTSECDAEAILHLFEEAGHEAIPKLYGMFAFAYLNARARQLVLCRDRLGIKPLYYVKLPETFVFASEVKALFSHPRVKIAIDQTKVREFIQYRYIAGPGSLFADVQELRPGHYLTLDLNTMQNKTVRYWQSPMRAAGNPDSEGSLPRALRTAINRRLMSDVPLGTQLSGGLDSSLVTALAVKEKQEPTHTFSVSFAGTPQDESSWAELVSSRLRTIHHRMAYAESEFLEDLAGGTYLHDDPLNHPNSLPMFKLCREAKKYVTVLLTGEGADELFGGYSWHRRMKRMCALGVFAHSPLLKKVSEMIPVPARLSRISGLLGKSSGQMAIEAGKWVDDSLAKRVLHSSLPEQAPLCRSSMRFSGQDPLSAVLDLDLQTYLVSVLQRQDRMSMAAGVESRVPFLDHEFVEMAVRVPVSRLFEHGRGKAPLRRMARNIIPDEVIQRPKIGFQVPISQWMKQDRGLGRLLAWLCDDQAQDRKIWEAEQVRSLIRAHRRGTADNSDILWSLLALEIWARLWLDGTDHHTLREQILRSVEQKV